MSGATFVETLRRSWKSALYWGIGFGSLALIQIIAIPDAEAIKQVAELMETLPPALVAMFGGEDTAFMATPDGYLAVQFFSFGLLILAAYAVINGLNVISSDEDRNILDMVLSLPVARWQIIIEKFLAYLVTSVVVVTLTLGGLWLGAQLTPSITYSMDRIAVATFNMLPSLVLVTAVTIFISALFRRRGLVTTLATTFVVGSYFLDALGLATGESGIGSLRAISFYSYYDGVEVVKTGLAWGNVALLLGISVVLIALSVVIFQRRDISV
jgi:ABC-2 type transport system permease protein